MGQMSSQARFAAIASVGLFVAALGVGACSSDQVHDYRAHSDKVTAGAGDAMASNRAVHTIDPWPYHSQKTQIDMDGKRAQAAVRRYESKANAKK
jgi:hypothetical protein